MATFSSLVPSSYSNKRLTHTASVEATLGDLAYFVASTGKVSPADQLADQGTEAATQRLFASLFAGIVVGNGQSSTNSTSSPATLAVDSLVPLFACDSNTFEIGDYVAPKYTAGVLDPQTVVKVTDPTRAVGKVTKRYTAATTTVEVRFTSPLLVGLLLDAGSAATRSAPPAYATSAPGSTLTRSGGDGFYSATGTASAGGPGKLLAGVGGGTTSGTGGAAGKVVVGGTSAGGAATTGTPGAGADTEVRSQAGGAASAGTGNGGAAGNVNLLPASGGTSFGGTAGANGAVQVNGKGFIQVPFIYDTLGNKVTQAIFTALNQAYRVRGIVVRPRTAEGGVLTASFYKANSGTAIGSGTVLHTGSANLNGTADTNQSLSLSATAADLLIAAGQSIGFVPSTTISAATGTVTIELEPMG